MKQEGFLKGAWESYEQFGQTPDTREGMSMVAVGKDVYMYGGQGRTMFDDLRLLDCSKLHQYVWSLVEPPKDTVKTSLLKPGETDSVPDHPGPRTAAVLCRYN
jgi:hypothetical protein